MIGHLKSRMVISSNLGPQIGSVSYHSMQKICTRSWVNYPWVPEIFGE